MSYAMPPGDDKKPKKSRRTTILVGRENELSLGDRLVLATWIDAEVPRRGNVFLTLTGEQQKDLCTVMGMLNKE